MSNYRRGFSTFVDRFNHVADQLERMNLFKDRLLRDVSHELRSPLTRMTVAIDMLDDSKLKMSLKKDSQIMNRLIHDLLESYRVQKSKSTLKELSLTDLLNSMKSYYQSTELKISIIGTAGLVWPFDSTLTEVIFKNLIENSVKYVQQKPVKFQIQIEIKNSKLLVSYCDNGPGIFADDLPYIFDPFFRSSVSRQQNNPDGFGLVLSIVKSYVELQNGRVSVRNAIDSGAVFQFGFQLENQIQNS